MFEQQKIQQRDPVQSSEASLSSNFLVKTNFCHAYRKVGAGSTALDISLTCPSFSNKLRQYSRRTTLQKHIGIAADRGALGVDFDHGYTFVDGNSWDPRLRPHILRRADIDQGIAGNRNRVSKTLGNYSGRC
jgi:hypothetical protein